MSSAFREPKLQLKSHAYKSVRNLRINIISGSHSRIGRLAVVTQERERSKRNGMVYEGSEWVGLECWIVVG